MIESFPQNFGGSQEEKQAEEKGIESEMEFENSELFESKEKELREGFAKELRKPHEGSYFKKLQRIAAAFALAGLVTIAAPEKATLPEKSKDFKEFELLDYYHENDPFRYLDVLTTLQEKMEKSGGISVSPQLPEEIYKPRKLNRIAQMQIGKEGISYFSKPEIVLGEEFIKKNPEKAKEYFEKISKTQKATVIIEKEGVLGSGVIINTDKGKIILTNQHVVEGQKNTWIRFINGNIVEAKVLDFDKKNDIAILKIDLPEDIIEKKEVLKGTNSLDLASDVELKPKDELALIGHPIRYPFEVSLAKVENIGSDLIKEGGRDSFISATIYSEPDKRFAKLATYGTEREDFPFAHKGESVWGMSGGPIIKLDEKGEPRLSGINSAIIPENANNPFSSFISAGVHNQLIKNFLEKSGYSSVISGEEKPVDR